MNADLRERMQRLEDVLMHATKEVLVVKELMAIEEERKTTETQPKEKSLKEEIMYVKDCADILGVSPQRVRYLVMKNEIPCYKSRGRVLFKRSEIEDFCFKDKQPTIEELESESATYIAINKRK